MNWYRRLTLRGRTLVVGVVLTLALVGVGAAVPIPYVALGPGTAENTLGLDHGVPVISFTGTGFPTTAKAGAGRLDMTTVALVDHIPLFAAVSLWAGGRYALVPREDEYPPNKSEQQVTQEGAQQFSDSQSNAEIAALEYLGTYPKIVYVGTIPAGSPSLNKLQPQDQITAVDSTKITDYASLKAALAPTKPGQVVAITVLRAGKAVTQSITLGSNTQVGAQGFLGIGATERPSPPFKITISLLNVIGPSAGLMFALGIVDKLGPTELTNGRHIAGTGTIDVDGTVGAIGGILLKMIAARGAGATIFLVPEPNCEEALTQVPAGLQLVKVTSLTEAVAALVTIGKGGTPPGC